MQKKKENEDRYCIELEIKIRVAANSWAESKNEYQEVMN